MGELVSNRPKRARPPGRDRGDSIWSAADALRIKDQLATWLNTRDGTTAVYVNYHGIYNGAWPASVADPWKFCSDMARLNADALAQADLIWCDPPMVDLLAAASIRYPDEPIRPYHLPSPDGIAILARPVPALWEDADAGE